MQDFASMENHHPFQSSESEALVSGMLLASPHLTDPNFQKSVILLLEHHAKGALGMIVNKPSDQPVNTAFQQPAVEWTGDPEAVIWYGGPVMRESCWMLHEPASHLPDKGQLTLADDLVLSSSAECLLAIAASPPERIRFIRGVAGWGASQLDDEIAGGYWLTADLDPQSLWTVPPDEMWGAAYRAIGVDPAWLAFNEGIH